MTARLRYREGYARQFMQIASPDRSFEGPPLSGDDGHLAGPARPRLAILSFSSGVFDARSFRLARSALDAGYEVTIYARLEPGLPAVEQRDGYRLVRVPADWRLAVPGLRSGARRRAAALLAEAGPAALVVEDATDGEPVDPSDDTGDPAGAPLQEPTAGEASVGLMGRVLRRMRRPFGRWRRLVRMFPMRPLGWAVALEAVVEPADIWHGMWAGSLPALERMRRGYGGRTVYDSRDVYMESRDFARLEWPLRPILAGLERRWARSADAVLTVNDLYADTLASQLGVRRPPVVMNCPARWSPPAPPPDLIRATLALPADIDVVLYQGQLISERGIEQAMDAILEVPGAVLVLLGFGRWAGRYGGLAAEPPYRDRVFVLPPVTPDELLAWTASADVMIMPIQPTTLNHRMTTPQKLFEAIAAGVPVVVSDLPGMARIVSENGIGERCDPTSARSIAEAIRRVLAAPPPDRQALRRHVLDVAHEQFNWETQVDAVFALYRTISTDRAVALP
jgi:glycosyltransferase involved in cell wall biosynthesis